MGSDEAVRWPKRVPVLTEEQEKIRDEFLYEWLKTLPASPWYRRLELFNQTYVLPRKILKGSRTLEIGGGLGAHLEFEEWADQEYTVLEMRPEFVEKLKERWPGVEVVQGDIQRRCSFEDDTFDRVVAIHVLEHLPNLPAALKEIRRVLKPEGVLSVVIPCEGGWVYEVARKISTKRMFERKYKTSYEWFIRSEHVNTAQEIIEEMEKEYLLSDKTFWPTRIPVINLNLVIGMTLRIGDARTSTD